MKILIILFLSLQAFANGPVVNFDFTLNELEIFKELNDVERFLFLLDKRNGDKVQFEKTDLFMSQHNKVHEEYFPRINTYSFRNNYQKQFLNKKNFLVSFLI